MRQSKHIDCAMAECTEAVEFLVAAVSALAGAKHRLYHTTGEERARIARMVIAAHIDMVQVVMASGEMFAAKVSTRRTK